MWLLVSLLLLPEARAQLDQPAGRDAFIAASIHYHEGSYDQAIAGYERTIALHHEVPFSKMMIARLWALKGDLDRAMTALDEAAEFEFAGVGTLQLDPEFATIRQDARYPEILAKVRANAQPCVSRARRRQFDFWLGTWDVTGANGAALGTDTVELAEGGCLLRETWKGLREGGTGISHSFHDRFTGYWRQVWMDPGGIAGDYSGELVEGAMVLRQITYNGGLKTILVLTYTPMADGTVEQKTQRSVDDGVTWNTLGTLTFTRRRE